MIRLLEQFDISYIFCCGSPLRYLCLIYTQRRPSNVVQMIPHIVLLRTSTTKQVSICKFQSVNSYLNYLSYYSPLTQVLRKMYFDKGFAVWFRCFQVPVNK